MRKTLGLLLWVLPICTPSFAEENKTSHLSDDDIKGIFSKSDEPEGSRFKRFTCPELVPFILGEKRLEKGAKSEREDSIAAFRSFKKHSFSEAEKTKDGVYQLQLSLAESIFFKLRSFENPHDHAHLVYMASLCYGMDQIRLLLKETKHLDCCYGRALMRSLARSCGCFGWSKSGGTIDDWQLLLSSFDKEDENARGIVSKALANATGAALKKKDGTPAGKEEWEAWWNGSPFAGALPRKEIFAKVREITKVKHGDAYHATYYEEQSFWIRRMVPTGNGVRSSKDSDELFRKVWHIDISNGPSGPLFECPNLLLDAKTGEVLNLEFAALSPVNEELMKIRKQFEELQNPKDTK